MSEAIPARLRAGIRAAPEDEAATVRNPELWPAPEANNTACAQTARAWPSIQSLSYAECKESPCRVVSISLGSRCDLVVRQQAVPSRRGSEDAMNIHFNDTQSADAPAETLFEVITDYINYPRFNSALIKVDR